MRLLRSEGRKVVVARESKTLCLRQWITRRRFDLELDPSGGMLIEAVVADG